MQYKKVDKSVKTHLHGNTHVHSGDAVPWRCVLALHPIVNTQSIPRTPSVIDIIETYLSECMSFELGNTMKYFRSYLCLLYILIISSTHS